MNGRIAINGEDEASFDELVCLNRERPIIDGGLRCVHVVCTKRCVASSHSLDLHLMVTINQKILRSRLIVTVITP